MPHRGADFRPLLQAAGFTVTDHHVLNIAVPQADAPALARYATVGFTRMREVLEDKLTSDDLAALNQLLDPNHPESLTRRHRPPPSRSSHRSWRERSRDSSWRGTTA